MDVSADWLNLENGGSDYRTVVERLNASPFDELVEIDLINDRCRIIHHIEGKYFVPFTNGGWTDLFHYCTDHMVHPGDKQIYADLMDPDTLYTRLRNSPVNGVLNAQVRYRGVDGKWIWTLQVLVSGADNGLPEGIVYCYIFDISVQKQRERGDATSLKPAQSGAPQTDELTGLMLDREFFALAQKKLPMLSPGQWCVVAVDIDHFKLFCDWHGQQAGRLLLAEIGAVLRDEEQATGGIAGYRGQDGFALLIPYDTQRINDLYERIRSQIAIKGDFLGFQPIFGICMVENSTDQIVDLYNRAALTAEQTRGDFRNRIRIYNPVSHRRNSEEYRIISQFQRALDEGEVFFCLQPQCRLSTGRVMGAEALARWRTKEGRMIPSVLFVPILEKYGMVTNLDKFIWEGVCQWLRKWLDEGHTAVPISLNVSQLDIFSIDVPGFFDLMLEKYRLPAALIKVEITESAYVEDTAAVRETVRRLRSRGFLVLMDDFGSGYSSLNMLRRLSVDVIKLDAQFLSINSNESRKGINILESIINMARTMSIPVVVEGVETQEQIDFLAGIGCSYMQGYYFYRPMPVEEFEGLIADEHNIDLRGFEIKANEQLHTREFLDENVVSDAMLNNILGPVAIVCQKGEDINIIRYNHQFLQLLGFETGEMDERRAGIQRYLHPEDRARLFQLLEHAERDRLSGAKCLLRVYRSNGMISWLSLQAYFMEESEQGKRFYGSVEDVTELQYVNRDIPGGYHRCSTDGEFTFYYISQGFLDMVGYTREEIRRKFDNRFINMVHRDDLDIMLERVESLRQGRAPENKPYRLKRKQNGYIYVVNQTRLTELDNQLCYQSVAIDVTDVVKLRNQMRLLSRFSSDDVVFVRRKEDGWRYRVIIHGLGARLGMSAKEFEKYLNSGELYRRMDPVEARRLAGVTMTGLEKREPFEFEFTMNLPDGRPVKVLMKTDFVSDKNTKVEYICTFREG